LALSLKSAPKYKAYILHRGIPEYFPEISPEQIEILLVISLGGCQCQTVLQSILVEYTAHFTWGAPFGNKVVPDVDHTKSATYEVLFELVCSLKANLHCTNRLWPKKRQVCRVTSPVTPLPHIPPILWLLMTSTAISQIRWQPSATNSLHHLARANLHPHTFHSSLHRETGLQIIFASHPTNCPKVDPHPSTTGDCHPLWLTSTAHPSQLANAHHNQAG